MAALIALTSDTDLDALLGADDFDCFDITGRFFSERMTSVLPNGRVHVNGYRVTAELVDGSEQYLHCFAIEQNARHFITELSLGRVAYDIPRAVEIETDGDELTLIRSR